MRGTLDRPLLFGHAEIDRGEVEFEGRRYLVTRGSLDFANANRIQPFFDIEAETRVRVPGQTYRVTMRMAGTTERMQPQFTSDPPLQTLDILTLLFSDQAPSGDIELAGLQRPERARAAAGRGARHARADRRAVAGSRPRRRADLRRRHVPDHAAAVGSVSAVGEPEPQPERARHDRQAHLEPHLPDLRAQPVVVDARSDHPARVRRERIAVVGAVAERGSHLRARSAKEARVLMRLFVVAAGRLAALLAIVAARPRRRRTCSSISARPITDVRVEIAGVPVDRARRARAGRDARRRAARHAQRARAPSIIWSGSAASKTCACSRRVTDQGVALRWQLMPVRRITQDHRDRQRRCLSATAIRAELTERFGALPSANRIDEMVTRLQAFYADARFRARVDPAADRGRRAGARTCPSWC